MMLLDPATCDSTYTTSFHSDIHCDNSSITFQHCPDIIEETNNILFAGIGMIQSLPTDNGRGTNLEKITDIQRSVISKLSSIGKPKNVYSPRSPHFHNTPPKIVPTLTLSGERIGSPGNMTVFVGNPGAGKSAICEAISAAVINPECDSLRLGVCTPKNVVYIDTERSWEDHHTSWLRAMRRAGTDKESEKLHWFWISDCDSYETKVSWVLDYMNTNKPGIVLLDGIADLIPNVNDPEKSNVLLTKLLACIKEHGINLLTTIHGNPNGGKNTEANEKARGHLGSETMRKAESVLMIKKEGQMRTITTCFGHGKNRSGTDQLFSSYIWSDDKKMFVSCDELEKEVSKPSVDIEYDKLYNELAKIKAGPWSYSELIKTIMDIKGKTKDAAKWSIKKLSGLGLVLQYEENWWVGKDILEIPLDL